ncbi:MAG: hypothetical protein L6R45_18995 [Anaerolineae bacterium]|nr:hypothetical protein [Anaerolineae bacterium]
MDELRCSVVWWLQLIFIWLSIDLIVIATGWYIVTLKQYFPNWWEQVIACEVKAGFDLDAELMDLPNIGLGSKVAK